MSAFGKNERHEQDRADGESDDCGRTLPADAIGIDQRPHDAEKAGAKEDDSRIVQA
jgi:hypothetical protein